MTDDERRLREAFQAQREVDRAQVPGFRSIVNGRSGQRPRSSAMPVLAIVLMAGLIVLTVSIRKSGARQAEIELARQVMSWRSPTEFLLPASVPGLAPSVSRIDEAPAGSPLKALDRGGAFGPPITVRSPRS